MTITVDTSRLSSVVRSSTYLAMRSVQGGRDVYSIRVPLHDLIDVMPIPDPDYIDEDNRRVNVRHAKEFGLYLKNSRWVAPALLARDAGSCTYAPLDGSDGMVGYLTIPWTNSGMSLMLTIDGQHRILGIYLEIRRIAPRSSASTACWPRKGSRRSASPTSPQRRNSSRRNSNGSAASPSESTSTTSPTGSRPVRCSSTSPTTPAASPPQSVPASTLPRSPTAPLTRYQARPAPRPC